MDKTSSSLFQRTYHRLKAPTQVTVHGQVIGVWYPASAIPPIPAREYEEPLVQPFSKAMQAGRKS